MKQSMPTGAREEVVAEIKASQVVAMLQDLIEKHGDREVGIYDSTENEFVPVYKILARKLSADDLDRRYFTDVFFGITNYEIGDWHRQIDLPDLEEG